MCNRSSSRSLHNACVLRCRTPFGGFDLTLFPIQTLPLPAGAPYPRAFSAFVPTTWIPGKIPRNRSQHALLNDVLTFPLVESQSNHSFVGVPHGGRQLCAPEMRLLGLNSLGLIIYLLGGLQDFLPWVVLGTETRNDIASLLPNDYFSPFSSSPTSSIYSLC